MVEDKERHIYKDEEKSGREQQGEILVWKKKRAVF